MASPIVASPVTPHERQNRRVRPGKGGEGSKKSKRGRRESNKSSCFGLRLGRSILLVVILVQSVAIITLYERNFQPRVKLLDSFYGNAITSSGDESNSISSNNATTVAKDSMDTMAMTNVPSQSKPSVITWTDKGYTSSFFEKSATHTTPNPGGLILSASFSYRQDPREVNRRRPLPHILPTFENMYHFHTTVNHEGLHAIIFHEEKSFNDTFVRKYTSDHVKFVKVEAPTFDNGEPIISPNDFRYVVFDKWLKANSQLAESGEVISVNGIKYNWFLIADLDLFFNRNPFDKLDEYATNQNITFSGSFDGGIWANEKVSLQRKLFRKCYGQKLFKKWKEDLEWSTENGNCGLWAGRYRDFSCVLDCMANQYNNNPVKGKGASTICDMVTHDYCVHYGGCFPGSTKGQYDTQKVGVLWGKESHGWGDNLFGPTYGKMKQCDKATWTVVHNRCNIMGPICFKRDGNGGLVKYHQPKAVGGKYCRLDPVTDLPLDDPALVKRFNITL